MREEDLFHAALGKSEAERASFLDQACAGNAPLRAAVEALLAAHETAGTFFSPHLPGEMPLEGDPAATQDSGVAAEGKIMATGEHLSGSKDTPNSRVSQTETADLRREMSAGAVVGGRFTLQEKIGEGGMGEVWVARQTEPVKRKVALKLIKTGMDSRAVLKRFEQERQALALMDHPHIARVLDGGLTPTGQPYFVMELVNGLPLNKFCDELKLPLKDRLELFVPICQAVQHAHQKGIVHRDLKPANILVTMIDGKPVPKVIDFGVAKATSGKLTEETMSTGFGAVVGTLEYMSPEQAGFSGEDIDTRADIYSLGVVLYELLTGLRPIDGKRLKQAALNEMIRIIREEEPSKPSTRLSTDASLPSLAAVRQIEPRKLTALLRGELDWVVMKCLEKQRDRRYETANALARDIQRYLADEAVEARPPSAAYRLQKFVRRHKGQVLATSLLFLALLAGVISTSLGLREAMRQESLLIAAEGKTREERDRAIKAEAEASSEASKTKTINAFLIEDLLTQAAPEKNAQENHVTLLEVLDRAADNVDERFEKEPEIEAALRFAICMTYFNLSSFEKAERQIRAMLELSKRPGAHPGDLYAAQSRLALVLMKQGRVDAEVLDMARSSNDELRRLFGLQDSRVHTSMNNLASIYSNAGKPELALPLLEELLELTENNDSDTYWSAMNNLCVAYELVGQPEKGLKLLEASLDQLKAKHGPDHPVTLSWMSNLGYKYLECGEESLGFSLLEEAFELRKARLGPNHFETLGTMGNLAAFYHQYGHLAKAMPLLEENFQLRRTLLGDDHPQTLNAMGNMACFYLDNGQLDKAMSLSEDLLRLSQAKLGPDHPSILVPMKVLAGAYNKSGKLDMALQILEQALRLAQAKLGRDHPQTLAIIGDLGLNYSQAGRQDKAIPLKEETVRSLKDRLGIDHPETLTNMSNLALSYSKTGQLQKAVELHEEVLKVSKEKFGAEHFITLESMDGLARLYRSIGQVDKALPLGEEALRIANERFGTDHPTTLTYRKNLATDYQAAGEFDKALELLEPTLNQSQTKLGPDHSVTLEVIGALASLYKRIEQPDKALSLYEDVLQLTRAKLGPEHPATLSAMNRLGEQFREMRQADKAQMLHEEAFRVAKERLGADHPDTLSYMNNLALDYQLSGQLEKFKQLLEECLKRCEATLGPEHPQTVDTKFNLALAYWSVKEFDTAISLHHAVLANREPRLGRNHPETLKVVETLGTTYRDAGRWAEAMPFVEEVYQVLKQDPYPGTLLIEIYAQLEENEKLAKLLEEHLDKTREALPEKSPQLAGALAHIGMILLKGQRWAEAEPLCRECLAIREQAEPDAWTTFNTNSMLGEALLGQHQYEDAELLLLAGYEGMKKQEEKIPPPAKTRLNEALDRLVRLYVAMQKTEEAARWQAELDRRTAAENDQAANPPDTETIPLEIGTPGK